MLEIGVILLLVIILIVTFWPLLIFLVGIGVIYYLLKLLGVVKSPVTMKTRATEKTKVKDNEDIIDVSYTIKDEE